MNEIFIILWMIFFHIVDDYYLQGWLASAKQKHWWEVHSPQSLYKHDYVWALIMHAFSWTFMIMLPITYVMNFIVSETFIILFMGNWVIHAVIDDLKANKHKINLWHDQIVHLIQIVVTAAIMLN